VTITAATSTGRLDPRPRGVSVSGLRAGGEDRWTRSRCRDGFWGPEYRPGEPVAQWTGNGPDATLLVPVTDGPYEIRLGADEPRVAELTVDGFTTRINVDTSPSWYPVPGGTSAFDVIHNVGVELVSDGYGADRGYLEFDDGRFDEPVDVFAWCGGAVVLSTSYLRDVGLFDERLFLYYEDVELSWRGSRAGWRYRAVPVSTVRHIHSAAASENAIRTAQWNERNRLLVLARHSTGAETRRALWHYIRATFSYARRDLVSPLLERRPPNPATVAMRARAFGGFLTSAPAFVRGPAKVPG